MFFKRLEMHGFKSFAEPAAIEFDRGITCVVGPNGSGKSNISDAVRWVLGEQSPGMLRGGKMEEVIFSGTAGRRSRGMAEVTLVIDNEDGRLPVDFREVAITRCMYRSGESEYRLNGIRCRLRDIRKLTMDTGIGVEGYSVIGQGRISDIISNKSGNRREIFEEAAGIVSCKNSRNESEKKLRETSGNMDRVNDIISELEERVGGLEKESARAEEYLEIRKRYRELEINLILRGIDKLTAEKEQTQGEIRDAEQSCAELSAVTAELDERIAGLRRSAEETGRQISENSGELISRIESLNEAVSRRKLEEERRASAERSIMKLENETAVLEKRLEEERASSAQLEAGRAGAEERLSELSEDLGRYSRERGILASELARTDSEAERLRHMIAEAQAVIDLRTGSCEDDGEPVQDSLSAEEYMEQLGKRAAEAADRLDAVRKTAERTGAELGRLRKDNSELRISLGRISSRAGAISEMESGYEGYSHAVRYIMKKNLPGITGIAADLIKVPAGYETAVETALGGALQNIVCEDSTSAENAINILKRDRAGRLTFLPLSTVRGRMAEDRRLEQEPGFIGYGPECVNFDERYRNIVYYLLGRVVLVDDMRNALRLSAKTNGLRFVTLDGELVNAGGAVTGGRRRNRTAEILGRKSELARLNQQTAQMETELAGGERRIAELEEKLAALSADEKRLEQDLQDAAARVKAAESRLETADRRAELEKLLADCSLCSGRSGALRKKIETLENTIMETRIAVNSCENEKNHIDLMLKRIKMSVSGICSDIRGNREQMQEFRDACGSAGAEETDEDIRMQEEDRRRLQERARGLEEEKERTERLIGETGFERGSAEAKLNSFRKRKYELEIRLAKEETQLRAGKKKLWDEFEMPYAQAAQMRQEGFAAGPAARESRRLKNRLRELGEVNTAAVAEYRKVRERYDFMLGQRRDIMDAASALEDMIKDTDRTMKARFRKSFEEISGAFAVKFRELFGGGRAELRLSDRNDPVSADIDIIAQPPGKKLQNINLLSGGEKTLTAIALMFAVLEVRPAPFCILDEVEAALDDANIDRFIKCMRKLEGIQFTLVTHQKATMEHADVIYGVTMAEKGVSEILSLSFEKNFEI